MMKKLLIILTFIPWLLYYFSETKNNLKIIKNNSEDEHYLKNNSTFSTTELESECHYFQQFTTLSRIFKFPVSTLHLRVYLSGTNFSANSYICAAD